jgi:DNA-directed RNA polymerase sigma subunit (sigma70/sigma32)
MLTDEQAQYGDEDEATPPYLRIPDPAADTEADALANVAVEELRERLNALSELSPTEAWVIRARYGLAGGERLSVREVAGRLNVAISTAHAIERRSLRALQGVYEAAAA